MGMDGQMAKKATEIWLSSEFSLEEWEAISMERIEEEYALEDEMLKAVSEGNEKAAMDAYEKLLTFPNVRYTDISLQSSMIALATLNTLLRKAVQNAEVHPAHIDYISAKFAEKIQEAKTLEKLGDIPAEMVRKYCLLVRSYSLRGYSSLAQQALNYIDFNLTEDLSLTHLAYSLNVNKKYLSAHFKKEVGETITDYINKKRVHDSLKYLCVSDLPISDVALRVGMYDLNYYSRVFKKIMDMTPSRYRKMMRET